MTLSGQSSGNLWLNETRACAWCSGSMPRRHRRAYCSAACKAEHRRAGPRTFAYADPPYPGQCERLYSWHPDFAGEVDHVELVARLCDEYPDGWALSTGASHLHDLLPLVPRSSRVLAWVKPQLALKPSVGLQWSWEPVILHRGRPRHPMDDGILMDHLALSASREGELIGNKPYGFCIWLFRALGARPGDELADLFPGTGGVMEAWRRFQASPTINFAGPVDVDQLELVEAG